MEWEKLVLLQGSWGTGTGIGEGMYILFASNSWRGDLMIFPL